MKLFLTATSERGKPITKSGNDWLKIEVVNEDREVIFTKTLTAQNDICYLCKNKNRSSCIACKGSGYNS
jgi:hypothetical protein